MSLFSKLFQKNKLLTVSEESDESDAMKLDAEITLLEKQLKADPSIVKIQQELVAKYSQAASVFAQAPSYRDRVGSVFARMNELRNVARSNF